MRHQLAVVTRTLSPGDRTDEVLLWSGSNEFGGTPRQPAIEMSREVLAVAEHVGADLLVMGTVCRTGVSGFFMGNTAEQVLQQVECSVLTVKPDRFITPVERPTRFPSCKKSQQDAVYPSSMRRGKWISMAAETEQTENEFTRRTIDQRERD